MRAGLILASLLAASLLIAAPATRRPPPEPTAQIKLRDLLELVPRKESPEGKEIIARLARIEERLTAIEQRLPGAVPIPLPGVAPPPAPQGAPR